MNEIGTAGSSEIESNLEPNGLPTNDHVDSIDLEKTFKCKHSGCSATFSKSSKLIIHIRQHTGERPYKCDYDGCDKSYTNPSHLKRHCKMHNMVKQSLKCCVCSTTISNRHNLKRHYERFHSENSQFSCKECGLKFTKEQKYKEHEAVHQGVALYKCEICSRQFMALSTFRKHKKLHDKKKEYPCAQPNCSEVFEKWSLLCKHRNSKHISEYKCKDCDKVFFNKYQLKLHSVVHMDDRSILPCPYEKCPRFYFFKRNLDHHYRTSHLGKKYHCDICDMRLSTKQKITEHINKIHLEKKKKKKKTSKSERRKRKDAGTVKISMLSKLAGLELHKDIEKDLLNRKTIIPAIQEDPDQISAKNIENSEEMEILDQILRNGYKEVTINGTDDASSSRTDVYQIISESSDQVDDQ